MIFLPYQDSDGVDTDANPEIALLLAEGDEAEAEIEASFWLAGTAVTHPHDQGD